MGCAKNKILTAMCGVAITFANIEARPTYVKTQTETLQNISEKLKTIITNHNAKIDAIISQNSENTARQIRIQSLHTLQAIYNSYSYLLDDKSGYVLNDVRSIFRLMQKQSLFFAYPVIIDAHNTDVLYFIHGSVDRKIPAEKTVQKILETASRNKQLQSLLDMADIDQNINPDIFLLSDPSPPLNRIGAMTFENTILINKNMIDRYPPKDRKNILICLLYNEIGNILASRVCQNIYQNPETGRPWQELISDIVMVLTSMETYKQTGDPAFLNTSLHLIIVEFWKNQTKNYSFIIEKEIGEILKKCDMDKNTPCTDENISLLIEKIRNLMKPQDIEDMYRKMLSKAVKSITNNPN